MSKRILIVEDEESIADLEKDYLELSNFEVEVANDGDTGLQKGLGGDFDLIILDLMLPEVDGFEICREVREKKDIPIIMVSAKKDDIDKIRGLGLGADDYMTKPFEIRELLMRIQAISRRSNHQDTSHPVVGNLSYDPATCEICNTQTGKSVQISGKEMQLLEFFMNNCNQVLEKNQITTKIWGFDSNAEYNNVEVYVSFLRRKFHHLQVNVTIRAIRGVGYIMEVSE